MKKKLKKEKAGKIDGLSSDDLKRIHTAVRKVWAWSHARRLAIKRALHADGFYRCESETCPERGKPVPKIQVDHIEPVGPVGGPDYIRRMFVPSDQLRCLCQKCHARKTREERQLKKLVGAETD